MTEKLRDADVKAFAEALWHWWNNAPHPEPWPIRVQDEEGREWRGCFLLLYEGERVHMVVRKSGRRQYADAYSEDGRLRETVELRRWGR